MWTGVPTMLPDIMASGMQKPKSVSLALSSASNWTEHQSGFHGNSRTYQHVLELYVPVHQALGVQIPDAFDHVDGDLQSLHPGQAGSEPAVQVASHPLHHQQHGRRVPAAVGVVYHGAPQFHDSGMLGHGPVQQERQKATWVVQLLLNKRTKARHTILQERAISCCTIL